MNFKIDKLGEPPSYIEVKEKDNWIYLTLSRQGAQKRRIGTGMKPHQALALAGMLKALAESLTGS